MIVTTAGRYDEKIIDKAYKISLNNKIIYVERNNYSLKRLFNKYQENILVVGKEKIELYTPQGYLKYHPNFSQIRIKRLLKGEKDAFIEATNLKQGSSIIDCTMGMLSDSLIASFVVGETGSVTALEAVQDIYVTINEGAQQYRHTLQELNEAVHRIKCVYIDALEYLGKQKDNSIDVVYFDPMFEQTIETSSGIQSLESLALYSSLTKEIINEAYRVSKERIVLKAHFRSQMFETFNFMRCIRTSSVFHYGVIIKK